MDNISVYRRLHGGKVALIKKFEHISSLLDTVHSTDRWNEFSNSFNIHYVRELTFDWDSEGRKFKWYIEKATGLYFSYRISNCYVAFDDHDRLITKDRLIGLWRAYRHELHVDWRDRIFGSQCPHPGRKSKCHRGSYYRLPRTMQEIRWVHAWDDEEFAPLPRGKRRRHTLPTAWDDRCRMSHKNKSWKLYRNHQWKTDK